MKTVRLYEVGEEVLIRARITDVAIDNGDIVYQVQSVDNGKGMGIWFKDDQLISIDPLKQPDSES